MSDTWREQTSTSSTGNLYAKCLHCNANIKYPYNSKCSKCDKDHFVVIHWNTSYDCPEYFSGEWSDATSGKPIFGYDLICGVRFKTEKEANEHCRKVKDHRKSLPSWWELPKSKGGYGLGKIYVERVSRCSAKESK